MSKKNLKIFLLVASLVLILGLGIYLAYSQRPASIKNNENKQTEASAKMDKTLPAGTSEVKLETPLPAGTEGKAIPLPTNQ